MKISGDYHLHTRFSDGFTSVFCHAKRARNLGLREIAITDHSFCSFVFHMNKRKWAKLKSQIASIDGIKVYRSIESNILNEKGDIDVDCERIKDLDILLVGFHRFLEIDKVKKAKDFVLANGYNIIKGYESESALIESNTNALISAIERYPIDVIAHPNHRMKVDMKRVIDCAIKNDVYIELNEKHIDVLEEYGQDIANSGAKLIIGTDAHKCSKTAKLNKVLDFIARHNIPVDKVYGIGDNLPTFKNKKDLDI